MSSESTVTPMLTLVRWANTTPAQRETLLQRPAMPGSSQAAQVSNILNQVRAEGDACVAQLTEAFDGVIPAQFEYNESDLQQALNDIEPDFRAALEDAAGRIRQFHQADKPADRSIETSPGLTCSVKYQPLSPVGLYIPGGSAPLVSTVLMLAIPAQIAACEKVVICTPPNADGAVANEILAAAALCGVKQVFCAGGAQAIAAMAYGTETVPSCAKLFGPGNSWVTEAKQQVSLQADGAAIDMPAGPSEVLVIADAQADPDFVAWDLLSQAEHGPDSQVILLTDSDALANQVIESVEGKAQQSPRANILRESLAAARVIVLGSLEQAIEISNLYAPEHLILNTTNADELALNVRHAGSVFVGPWTPESLGDYCSGTNHVLPTYGWARSHGALGTADFMRRMTLQQATPEALGQVGPTAELLAAFEGLDAHRMAVRARIDSLEDSE